jgi:hypothetical protein
MIFFPAKLFFFNKTSATDMADPVDFRCPATYNPRILSNKGLS